MAYMNIVIYTKDGSVVNRVMGMNPFRKSENEEMTQNPQEIADKYAAEHGYNSAERIAEKEGWVYFRLLQKRSQQAAFLPDVIKIGKTGKLQNVIDVIEKLRALNEGEKEA
jgi:hypothetical protein